MGARRRLCNFAGWLVTSPLAFFVAFVVDLVAWGVRELMRRTPAR
jgi:hypothetical protein